MRIEQPARVFGLALVMVASACGSVLQSPDGGPDSGADGGPVACHQLNESECRARTDCTTATCPASCSGDATFAGCLGPNEGLPQCPAFAADLFCPAPCSAYTDEASCATRSDCRANRCPNCDGTYSFSGCVSAATSAVICPGIACPATCSSMTTQASCDARPDCHSVFTDPGTCGCASAGCCAHFSSCASGKAMCSPPSTGVTCKIATPYCEGPAYVLSYTTNCYEGCVPAAACAVN